MQCDSLDKRQEKEDVVVENRPWLESDAFRRAVRREIKDALANGLGPEFPVQLSKQRQWYSTSEAWSLLDLSSSRQLKRMRSTLPFREGKHYRVISKPGAKRKTYQWHVTNCVELLETARYKLRPAKSLR